MRGQSGQALERQSLVGKVKNAVSAQVIRLLTVSSRPPSEPDTPQEEWSLMAGSGGVST